MAAAAVPMDSSTEELIKRNNERHSSDAPRVHVIWPDYDPNHSFRLSNFLKDRSLRVLSKWCVVTMDRMVDGDLKGALCRFRDMHSGTLVLLGHGDPDGKTLQTSRTTEVDLTRLSEEEMGALRKADRIVLCSCYSGRVAAPYLAKETKRSIIASPEKICHEDIVFHKDLSKGVLVLRGDKSWQVAVCYTPDTSHPIPLPVRYVPHPDYEFIHRAASDLRSMNSLTMEQMDVLSRFESKGVLGAARILMDYAKLQKKPLTDENTAWAWARFGVGEAFDYFNEFLPPRERCDELLQLVRPFCSASPSAGLLKFKLLHLKRSVERKHRRATVED